VLKEFKNFELIRHHFSTDIEENIKTLSKRIRDGSGEIAGTLFATASSLPVTYMIQKNFFDDKTIVGVISIVLSYLVIFFLSYGLYIIVHMLKIWLMSTDSMKLPGLNEIKNKIDDFDHIACDCILIALEFIEDYRRQDTNNAKSNMYVAQELKTFNFYEIHYYLKKIR